MKTKFTITLLLVCSMTFINCSIDTQDEIIGETAGRFVVTNEGCEGTEILKAGQNYDCGTVKSEIIFTLINGVNTMTHMQITYSTNSGWEITKTHLFIGKFDDIPINHPGNPRVGQFPYKSNEIAGTTEVIWTIPIDDFELYGSTSGHVAAHADVSLFENGNLIQSETAWGNGDPLPGNSWAMAFDFDLAVLAAGCGN